MDTAGNVTKNMGSAVGNIKESTLEMGSKAEHKVKDIKQYKMIKNLVYKCTTSGFISEFGGIITMLISIPAFYMYK